MTFIDNDFRKDFEKQVMETDIMDFTAKTARENYKKVEMSELKKVLSKIEQASHTGRSLSYPNGGENFSTFVLDSLKERGFEVTYVGSQSQRESSYYQIKW